MEEYSLHLLQGLVATDFLSEHNCWKLLLHFPIFHHTLDEPWRHHLAIICYGIVESKCVNRWNLCFVSYTHPRQRRAVPVGILSTLVFFRFTYLCLCSPLEG